MGQRKRRASRKGVLRAVMPAQTGSQLLRAAELLFGHDPLNIIGLASDAVSQPSVGLDGHAADDRIDIRPDLFGPALRSLTLVMNVFVYRKVVGHGESPICGLVATGPGVSNEGL